MCGIFGLSINQNSKIDFATVNSILNNLFILSESRGKESSGIAVRNFSNKTIKVLKKSIPASKLIKAKEYKDFISETVKESLKDDRVVSPLAVIAHARLVTNGTHEDNNNNQPVIKSGCVGVHNGIIVNVDELWKKHSNLKRIYEVDTEIFLELFQANLDKSQASSALQKTFNELYGAASVALLSDKIDDLVLATNTGSLYILEDKESGVVLFSSERYILTTLLEKSNIGNVIKNHSITWIKPGDGCRIDIESNKVDSFHYKDSNSSSAGNPNKAQKNYEIVNTTPNHANYTPPASLDLIKLERLLENNLSSIQKLQRCTKCLLPETFPFLSFDKSGVCSYCNSYIRQNYLGLDKLKDYADSIRNKDGNPDCLVAFSGGRDSSYSLHYIKKELNLNPIAYTYDWGMVTDLARRNQARICGKLGIEHILISADIKQKRKYISLNVAAWLRRPSLGTIPLFMAGDKQFFYYAYYLCKINKIKETILCENLLERTSFKSGFCGIKPHFDTKHNFSLSTTQKIQMLSFYGKEFLLNPAYLNSSLLDSAKAFATYYITPHSYFNLFDYLPWEEDTIEKTLISEYDWELSPDTTTTWRIGDGTASFYNYIYYTVAGFSEFDTFRSNQIREGMMDRETALAKVNIENRPRFESMKWYLDTIGLDFEDTIKTINKIPKLYTLK